MLSYGPGNGGSGRSSTCDLLLNKGLRGTSLCLRNGARCRTRIGVNHLGRVAHDFSANLACCQYYTEIPVEDSNLTSRRMFLSEVGSSIPRASDLRKWYLDRESNPEPRDYGGLTKIRTWIPSGHANSFAGSAGFLPLEDRARVPCSAN